MSIDSVNNKYSVSKKEFTEVEIGDMKQTEFYPQVKFIHWDNETNFSLRYSSNIDDASKELMDNKVVWTDKHGIKVRLYEKSGLSISDEDGFEFEFELPYKPKSNIFEMTIQTKGLTFFYQDEITDDDAQRQVDLYQKAYDEGHSVKVPTLAEAKRMMRPENVIGSYAVYHESKKNNEYKTGKAFHIYRPEAVDSEGNKTWCDLNIDTYTNILTITIPQNFLDNAVYPIIVDPTFGYTTAGATSAGVDSTQCYAYIVTSNATALIDKLVVYTKKQAPDNPSPFGKGIIFNGTSGTVPILTNGVAPAVQITSTTAGWVNLPYSTKPSVTNGNSYRLGWTSSQGFPSTTAYFDTQPAIDDSYDYSSPGDWAASFGENPSAQLSIYAEYTSVTIPPKWQHYRQSRV